jgi:hypothetical protein
VYLHWSLEDIVAFSFFIACGILWVVFPRRVIRFYRWFHRGKIPLKEDEKGIRAIMIAGALLLLLVLCIGLFAKPH